MVDTTEKRIKLHAALDGRYNAERELIEGHIVALERERAEGHKWIDSAPDFLLHIMDSDGAPITIIGEAKSTPASNGSNGSPDDTPTRVQLRLPVEQIILALSLDD